MFAAGILAAEYLALVQAFDIEPALERGGVWSRLGYLRHFGHVIALGAVGTSLAIVSAVRNEPNEGRSRQTFAAWHAAVYLTFVLLTWFVLARQQVPPGPPHFWIATWALAGVSSAGLLLGAALGRGVFRARVLGAAAIGGLVGVAALVVSYVAQEGWRPLAFATLGVAELVLKLGFSNVVSEGELLGVGDFVVEIAPGCSGYEGVGLVAVLIPTFLIAYRQRFRFPHALLLLPLGMVAVWFGNVARIATLVAVGVLVDPELAVGAFHSKIGWVFFTAITLGVAALGHHAHFFARDRERVAPESEVENPAAPYLMPLLALMGTALVTSSFANPIDHSYWLRVLVAAGVLVLFRETYRRMDWRLSWRGPVVGLVVAVAWLAPFAPPEPHLVAPSVSTAWLVWRVLGSALVVPLCEELAFRGYLLRRLQAHDFTTVTPHAWTWLSLLGSSLLFGVLHDRWLAGSLAGVAYAALVLRTGRLSEAVAAHAVTNGTIALWVLVAGDWSHWL